MGSNFHHRRWRKLNVFSSGDGAMRVTGAGGYREFEKNSVGDSRFIY